MSIYTIKTIAEVDVHALQNAIEKYLNVEGNGYSKERLSYGYSILSDILDEQFGNGHIETYNPDIEWFAKFPEDKKQWQKYVDQLIELNVLPKHCEIYIHCWW